MPPGARRSVGPQRRQEIPVATVIDQRRTEVVAWNELLQSFLCPIDGGPGRPGTLVVCRNNHTRSPWRSVVLEAGTLQLVSSCHVPGRRRICPAIGSGSRERPQSFLKRCLTWRYFSKRSRQSESGAASHTRNFFGGHQMNFWRRQPDENFEVAL